MKNTLTMRYPAGWHGDMWREGAQFGNGTVGGLVYGFYKNRLLSSAEKTADLYDCLYFFLLSATRA